MPNHRHLVALLAALPACAIERIEAIPDAHGMTDDTTGSDSDTSPVDTTGTTGDAGDTTAHASTGAVMTTAAADTGHGSSGEPATTGTTTGTTTGEAPPVCGNGLLEPSSVPPEECDDGNQISDDGCDDTCAADRVIFVSSELYQAGYLESLHVADGLCVNMAVDVPEIANPLKFRAWLSDSQTHARDRFAASRGRIVLVNGLVVADSWGDLLAGKLQTPIEVTADSQTYHGGVWTGTRTDGLGVPGATHCDDWTSYSLNKVAHYGYSDLITAEWTLSASFDNPFPCGGDFAIYCLQQP